VARLSADLSQSRVDRQMFPPQIERGLGDTGSDKEQQDQHGPSQYPHKAYHFVVIRGIRQTKDPGPFYRKDREQIGTGLTVSGFNIFYQLYMYNAEGGGFNQKKVKLFFRAAKKYRPLSEPA
jgi:hypothetical protein